MIVAFIGLGVIGGPMCERVLASGHTVAAYDPAPAPLSAVVARGARPATSPRDAGRDADVACIVVRDDAQALDAVDGPDGVLRSMPAGAVVLLHSTVAPSTVDRLGRACDAVGVRLVDAGVSGGADRARGGTLVAVVGGDPGAIDRARPVLGAYASDVVVCGALGTGMAAKLARNLAQYGIWCALFEAMRLAAAADVPLGAFADYVRASGLPGNHDVVLARDSVAPVGPDVDGATRARLTWAVELGAKDMDDAFELADGLGVDVPIGRIARRRFGEAMGLSGDR